MFGDVFCDEPIKGKINIIGGYAFKSKDFVEEGIPLIKIGTVNKGYFDLTSFSFLEENAKYNKWLVKPGDLLMSLTGTVGKDDYGNVEIALDNYDKYYLNQRVAKIIVIKNYNSVFLYAMFSDYRVKQELIKLSRGVRQANLSNDDILKLKLICPPIELQNQFAEKIANIEQQKDLAKQELQQAENLFNGLLQKAFKGEL